MSFATGGLALAATSTKSKPASRARFNATLVAMTPACSPLGPIRRTFGTRMSSLILGSLMMTPYNKCLCVKSTPSPQAPLCMQKPMPQTHVHKQYIPARKRAHKPKFAFHTRYHKRQPGGILHFLDSSSQNDTIANPHEKCKLLAQTRLYYARLPYRSYPRLSAKLDV